MSLWRVSKRGLEQLRGFPQSRRIAKSATVACSRSDSKAILAFGATSIVRVVFVAIVLFVYHDRMTHFQLTLWSLFLEPAHPPNPRYPRYPRHGLDYCEPVHA